MKRLLQYGLPIFLSALLLFLVQPIIAKYILPWFGGTPAVWTTCMVFFQAALLAGYAYAHALVRWLPPRGQAGVHGAVLLACLLFLPVVPGAGWKPTPGQSEVLLILGLLAGTIGGPYWVLSANSPLLQSWFGRDCAGASPYRLYALSNVGSLLALVSYPFLVEPALSLKMQVYTWSALFAAFAALCGWCAYRVFRAAPAAAPRQVAAEAARPPAPGRADRLLCILLPACASVLLLATTNQMSQDIPVVPFLWVLPLVVYLASFIICFDRERWYWRPVWAAALAAGVAGVYLAMKAGVDMSMPAQVGLYTGGLFAACMVCHGELVRLKPHPAYLTGYYLRIAFGGALGGAFVSLAAPVLFRGFWELPGGLVACGLLLLAVMFRTRQAVRRRIWRAAGWVAMAGILAGLTAVSVLFVRHARRELSEAVAISRGFYGVLRVDELYDANGEVEQLSLLHGRISHGCQFADAGRHNQPVSYYGPDSGVGVAIEALRGRAASAPPVRIGVVGLGAGVIAAWGEPGDAICFYEINPQVVRLSDAHFTYRRETPAAVEVVLGDARLSMERERREGRSRQFDLLVLDAFSGDAIPLHLLTREAMRLYGHHLRSDGILAVHISNRYIDLEGLVRGLADDAGMGAVLIDSDEDAEAGCDASTWVLAGAPDALELAEIESAKKPWPAGGPAKVVFTDDYSNLFRLLRRK